MPQYGPTRTRATWKPRVAENNLPFFMEKQSETILIGVSGEQASFYEGNHRSRLFTPDYASLNDQKAPEGLNALGDFPTPEEAGVSLEYKIVGGFETNALRVTWDNPPGGRLRWVALKTFTGFQVKYVQPGKFPPIVFAFADEDAYVYCNRDICAECSFKCKSGFMLYGYFDNVGIVAKPLSRVSEKPGC